MNCMCTRACVWGPKWWKVKTGKSAPSPACSHITVPPRASDLGQCPWESNAQTPTQGQVCRQTGVAGPQHSFPYPTATPNLQDWRAAEACFSLGSWEGRLGDQDGTEGKALPLAALVAGVEAVELLSLAQILQYMKHVHAKL